MVINALKKQQRLLLGNANTTLTKYIMAVPVIQITPFTHPSLISHHYMSFFKLKFFLNCKEQPCVISLSYLKLRAQAFQKTRCTVNSYYCSHLLNRLPYYDLILLDSDQLLFVSSVFASVYKVPRFLIY